MSAAVPAVDARGRGRRHRRPCARALVGQRCLDRYPRRSAPGDLFVALKGPNSDGHDFVADALAKGAAAAWWLIAPVGIADDAPLLLVDDTSAALRDLGRARPRPRRARIAGITGSVGKTGVKEALRLVLSPAGGDARQRRQPQQPLGRAAQPRPDAARSAAFGVFEMGMNHPGEITPLTTLVRPHVAVVTTVEPVHIEHFASVEAIADAKAEIFAGLEPGGSAVLNRDNAIASGSALRAREAGAGRIISFGRRPTPMRG